MRVCGLLLALAVAAFPAGAETNIERGKHIVDEALQALGGESYLQMQDRIETGRAYSFYREELNGLSLAKIYTRYLTRPEPPVPAYMGVRERQAFGKKQETAVIFGENDGYDISFRGARPLPDNTIERFRESLLRNVLYILRMRLGEPGLIFESRGSDVVENLSVDIVDITDADNRVVTVYFSKVSHLPLKQVTYRRDLQTKDRVEEVTRFTKFRDVGGGVMWPYDIQRERDGAKIYQMYSDSVVINNGLADNLFTLPANMKILKKPK